MLTSDQTARSHPALHLGVITATLSKPGPAAAASWDAGAAGRGTPAPRLLGTARF